MTDVRVSADKKTKEKWTLTDTIPEGMLKQKMTEINQDSSYNAQLEDGVLVVRQFLRD